MPATMSAGMNEIFGMLAEAAADYRRGLPAMRARAAAQYRAQKMQVFEMADKATTTEQVNEVERYLYACNLWHLRRKLQMFFPLFRDKNFSWAAK